VVAGGGGAGCLAARRLSEGELDVAVLERGGPAPSDLASASRIRDDPSIRLLGAPEDGWPYESSAARGDPPVHWVRAAGFGGRLNYWLGTVLRLRPEDLAGTRDPGLRWPVAYEDLEPYYDVMERELGCPSVPAGVPTDRVDEWFRAAARALGARTEPVRQAQDGAGMGADGRFRSFSPLHDWIPAALATGRCRLLPFTVVRRILAEDGRCCGVEAVDTRSGRPFTVRASFVVVATSTIETARLLLDSATPDHPEGLGNEGGQVGGRLMDHVFAQVNLRVSASEDDCAPGRPLQTCYVPEWPEWSGAEGRDGGPPSRFHVQVSVEDADRSQRVEGRRILTMALVAVGEGLPIPGNGVVLDPRGRSDEYGNTIPLVRFRWDAAHERLRLRMRQALHDLAGKLPCDVVSVDDVPELGGHVHEVGTARMGAGPDASVTSSLCEVRGVQNLFLVDGSVFVSCPHQNPTLTILANGARVCDALLDRAGGERRGRPVRRCDGA
jgi:choline dehydrogenase-like flavoprotein